MFGSQALETAIGLAVMFFIVATAASAMTEVLARLTRKRNNDLERGLVGLLKGETPTARGDLDKALAMFEGTSVWKAAQTAAGKSLLPKIGEKGPSYMSAKMFADAALEFFAKLPAPSTAGSDGHRKSELAKAWPDNLADRMNAMLDEGRDDLVAFKAGLENWFDEAMDRVEGAYKRWATAVLFVLGLLLAVSLNLSTIGTASDLWRDPVTRSAVVDSASKVVEDGSGEAELDSVARTTDAIEELNIPVGWDKDSRAVWAEADWWKPTFEKTSDVVGWLLTAILVMLGAPFWFDLLSKLVSVRGAGPKPPPAQSDNASATNELITDVGSSSMISSTPAGAVIAASGPQRRTHGKVPEVITTKLRDHRAAVAVSPHATGR